MIKLQMDTDIAWGRGSEGSRWVHVGQGRDGRRNQDGSCCRTGKEPCHVYEGQGLFSNDCSERFVFQRMSGSRQGSQRVGLQDQEVTREGLGPHGGTVRSSLCRVGQKSHCVSPVHRLLGSAEQSCSPLRVRTHPHRRDSCTGCPVLRLPCPANCSSTFSMTSDTPHRTGYTGRAAPSLGPLYEP